MSEYNNHSHIKSFICGAVFSFIRGAVFCFLSYLINVPVIMGCVLLSGGHEIIGFLVGIVVSFMIWYKLGHFVDFLLE